MKLIININKHNSKYKYIYTDINNLDNYNNVLIYMQYKHVYTKKKRYTKKNGTRKKRSMKKTMSRKKTRQGVKTLYRKSSQAGGESTCYGRYNPLYKNLGQTITEEQIKNEWNALELDKKTDFNRYVCPPQQYQLHKMKEMKDLEENLLALDEYEDALTEIIDKLPISSIISPGGESIDNVINDYSKIHPKFKNFTYGYFKNSDMLDEKAAADVGKKLTNVINDIPASSIISRSDENENTKIIQEYIDMYGDKSIDHINHEKGALEDYKRSLVLYN